MNFNDFKHLFKSSQHIGYWIHKQSHVKVESLTDWLLFDLSENIQGVYYQSLSGHDEVCRSGADWEWWFLFSNYCFAMRVQAIKLRSANDNYPLIAHKDESGLRIEKLLQDSARGNFMPFYAFYTDQQARVMCPNQRNEEGVFIAGGQRIYDAFISKSADDVAVADVLPNTLSLSCFAFCPMMSGEEYALRSVGGDQKVANRWRDSIITYYKSELGPAFNEEETDVLKYENIPGMREEVPQYIESFIGLSGKKLPDWWWQEFSGEVEGTNALLVFDLR